MAFILVTNFEECHKIGLQNQNSVNLPPTFVKVSVYLWFDTVYAEVISMLTGHRVKEADR